MSVQSSPPAWLFSFVDLAFLLLIAMTQLAADAVNAPDFGELIVPRIGGETSADLPAGSAEFWQLRVHPAASNGNDTSPFELVRLGGNTPAAEAQQLASDALAARLGELREAGNQKPLLAPHEDSRSRDLLDAVALLEAEWPSDRRGRRATVTRIATP